MKENGLSLLSIGLSTASFALIRFFIDPFVAQIISKRPNDELKIYVQAEIVIAIVTGLFLIKVSKWAFVLLLLVRSASLGFSMISEEAVWLRTFPKELLGLFFGLNQSAFFIGDFLGGLLSSVLYKSYGLDSCIWVVLTVMIANLGLFYGLVGRRTVCIANAA
jgi:predicted MFS family arabinose efflux permease